MDWFYVFLIVWVVVYYIHGCVDRHYEYKENIKLYELELLSDGNKIGE